MIEIHYLELFHLVAHFHHFVQNRQFHLMVVLLHELQSQTLLHLMQPKLFVISHLSVI
jgi:hypothetical protein